MTLLLDKIDRVGFVVEERTIVFECRSRERSVSIEFPLETFYRLIALALQLAGRLPETEAGSLVTLGPERIVTFTLSNGDVALHVTLPGGAPITFHLDCSTAREVAAQLARLAHASGDSDMRPN